MEIAWYVLLGLFFASYLVLGGYDYGVGVLLTRTGHRCDGVVATDPGRATLNAVGPFFLGNEVWLVATVGILFGAFPLLEGELLAGLYPAVALALAGVVVVTAAVQLRSRPHTAPARARWDRVVTAGSTLAAAGWGAVLAGLLQGVPIAADGHVAGVGHVFTPFAVAGGLTLVALVTVHGAAFLALRLPPGPARQTAQLGRRLVPVALFALGTATVLGLLSDRVRQTAQQPTVGLLLPVALAGALLLARRAFTRHRAGLAFAATSVALATTVLLVGATLWPYALVSTLDPATSVTIHEAAAGGPTLRLLSWLVAPLLPALLGFQLMSWWVFRDRLDARSPVYW